MANEFWFFDPEDSRDLFDNQLTVANYVDNIYSDFHCPLETGYECSVFTDV